MIELNDDIPEMFLPNLTNEPRLVKNHPTYNSGYLSSAYCILFTHCIRYLATKNKSAELAVDLFKNEGNYSLRIEKEGEVLFWIYFNAMENYSINFRSSKDVTLALNITPIHLCDENINTLLYSRMDSVNFRIPQFNIEKLTKYTMLILDTLELTNEFNTPRGALNIGNLVEKFFHQNQSTLEYLSKHYQTLVHLTYPEGYPTFNLHHLPFDWDTLSIEPLNKSKYHPLTVKTITHVHFTDASKVADVLLLNDDILHHYLIRDNQLEVIRNGLEGTSLTKWDEEISDDEYFHLLREKYTQYISDLEDSLNQE